MLAIAAGAQLVGGAVKGIRKRKAAKKMQQSAQDAFNKGQADAQSALDFLDQNKYEIPKEIGQNVALAQNELGSSALQSNMEAQADRGLAGQLSSVNRASTSGSDALAAATAVNNAAMGQYNNAAVAGAQERQQDLANLMGARSEMGDYRTTQQNYNVVMPFLQRMELAQGAITNAGNRLAQADSAMFDSAGMAGDMIQGAGSFLGSAFPGASMFGGGGSALMNTANPIQSSALQSMRSTIGNNASAALKKQTRLI
jgi:hypothetical protein